MIKQKTILAAILLGILALTGCSIQTEEAEELQNGFTSPQYDWDNSYEEPLILWGIPDLDRSYITKAFDRYRELTGNELEVILMPPNEFEEKMEQAFVKGGEKPDIIFSYGGTNIEKYNPDENFYDFTEEPWVNDLTNTSINQTVYNGRIIGLPHWEASISGTIYNKKIFEKYNLDIPATQEEFMQVCEVLYANGIIPLYMPCREATMLLYQFPLDSVVENEDILKELNDGGLSYEDIPQMEQIVSWYKTMAVKGYLGESYQTQDWDGMEEAMCSGKYAMLLCWDTWLYTDFKGNPDDFGLMPAFMGVPEEGTFEGPNLGLFIVNERSSRLESALNFITFLADPYNYNAAFEGIYTAPVFKNQVKSISTPQYQEAERLIERNFRDSVAWLRIRGFSQMDATAILEYMDPESKDTAEECLRKMDLLRNKRLGL